MYGFRVGLRVCVVSYFLIRYDIAEILYDDEAILQAGVK